MASDPGRRRAGRSDGLENRERLLDAATTAVRREGEKVPMATVATAAGVGVGTLYRHFPTRAALLGALAGRSYELVLEAIRAAAAEPGPGIGGVREFFRRTIEHGERLILPLHGGPVTHDEEAVRVRAGISQELDALLERGRSDGSIRAGVSSGDLIVMGAMLAHRLPNTEDWASVALRAAHIYLDGLAPAAGTGLPGSEPTRAGLERGFGLPEVPPGEDRTTV